MSWEIQQEKNAISNQESLRADQKNNKTFVDVSEWFSLRPISGLLANLWVVASGFQAFHSVFPHEQAKIRMQLLHFPKATFISDCTCILMYVLF